VNAVPVTSGLRLEVQYNSELFDEVTIRRWFDAYVTLLRGAILDGKSVSVGDRILYAIGDLLVYRDRTANEIRDIYATRFDGKTWSKPARVHADDWTMPACPVNGPSVAAREKDVVVAWYTAAGDMPTVKLARSAMEGQP